MRRSLDVVKRLFTVRSCNYDMPTQMPERPCLDYHIGRCKAPCILAQTQGEYAAMIDEVLDFLAGKPEEVVRKIRQRMTLAAESLDFERAASLRDVLTHLETMEEPAVVILRLAWYLLRAIFQSSFRGPWRSWVPNQL